MVAHGSSSGELLANRQPSVACHLGSDGLRIQAVYAHRADRPDRLALVRPALVAAMAEADRQFLRGSLFHHSSQQLRWVVDSVCQPVILDVEQPAGPSGAFFDWLKGLDSANLTRLDRKYMVFVDDLFAPCGQGMGEGGWKGQSYPNPSRPGADNPNEGNVRSVARLDSSCWDLVDGSDVVHELLHTLGAVQASAPYADGDGHCTVPGDVMCAGLMVHSVASCSSATVALLDCTGLMYYNPHPLKGSYLASHWNIASSHFLASPPAPSVSLSGAALQSAPVLLRALANVPAGQAFSYSWSVSGGCHLTPLGLDWDSPESGLAIASCSSAGKVVVSVVQADGASASASRVSVAPLALVAPLDQSLGKHSRGLVDQSLVQPLVVSAWFSDPWPAHNSKAVVRGSVRDASARLVPNVHLSVLSAGSTFSAVSDASGSFALPVPAYDGASVLVACVSLSCSSASASIPARRVLSSVMVQASWVLPVRGVNVEAISDSSMSMVPSAPVLYALQRFSGHSWRTVASRAASGLSVDLPCAGRGSYRVRLDAPHLGPAVFTPVPKSICG